MSKTETELSAMLQLQKANIGQYQADVEATQAEVEDITEDALNLAWIIGYADLIDEDKKTVFRIKEAMINGKIGDEIAAFPNFPAAAPPASPVKAGIAQRASRRNGRFERANGYTAQIGVALGIISPSGGDTPDDEIKPTLVVEASASGSAFSAALKMMGADGFKIQIRRMLSEAWADAGYGTTSPLTVVVTPTTPGQPERLQARVVLTKKNQPFGQPSDMVYVTVNP